ncbi:extensin [Drosophila rhopaloa]|uniref:Extensin n=1 Tax=Drosophila rhopaloa TaxID=1041015 RepID=A0A6P4F5C2_DRORH|nr:extensin [Drosophila rhopaloa]
MLNSRRGSLPLSLLAMAFALSTSAQKVSVSNRIAAPGEPLYYLMVDGGPLVTPNEPLKRTNRSLLKWWDDLFPSNNNCCNNNLLNPPAPIVPAPAVANNCYGQQLQDLDPFKQMKLFKKLPNLFTTPNPCGQCTGNCGQLPQPQTNYVAPQNIGPGDGDAGYVAPPASSYEAPAPPAPSYQAPAAPAPSYEAPGAPSPSYEPPAPPAPSYETPAAPAPYYDASAAGYNSPAPLAPSYDPPAPSYTQPESTSEVYGKTKEYGQAAQPNYVGLQPAQIVYQPIIYLSTPLASKSSTKVDVDEGYITQTPQPAPVYESLPPSCPQHAPPSAPPTPNYSTPSCQTPIRLSVIDQPYRVAPELFEEYNYRLALASGNVL